MRLRVISNEIAKSILRRHHPLGDGGHFAFAFGLCLNDRVHGVMTFGRPAANGAARCFDLRQCDTIELRKMWCDDVLPKNSESQALGICRRLIAKRYADIHVMFTYCEGEEKASAYKGAGWTPLTAHTYVSELRVGSKWYHVRDFNRYFSHSQAAEKRNTTRRKWAIGLTDRGRQCVEMAASKIPKRPDTKGSDGMARGEESTHANSRDGSTSQQAATASS
jgi:hypothetical protein